MAELSIIMNNPLGSHFCQILPTNGNLKFDSKSKNSRSNYSNNSGNNNDDDNTNNNNISIIMVTVMMMMMMNKIIVII